MADWTTLDVNGLLPGEPWTASKAMAVYENVPAAFEVASGAPRLARKFKTLSKFFVDQEVSVETGYEGLVIEFSGDCPAENQQIFFKLAFAGSSGGSYRTDVEIPTGTQEFNDFRTQGKIYVDLTTGAYQFMVVGIEGGTTSSGTGAAEIPPSAINRVIFRLGGASDEMSSAFVMMELTGKEASS